MSITPIQESDFPEWSVIWQQYREFSGIHAADSTPRETFDRLVAGNPNVCGLVVRDTETSKVVGLAHMVVLPSLRSRKPIGYMNGAFVSFPLSLGVVGGGGQVAGKWLMRGDCLDLFVDPAARRRGYGRMLVLGLAEEGRKMNCRKVSWGVDEDNVVARGLYDGVASICRLLYSIDLV